MDLEAAKFVDVFWKKNLSGPLNAKQAEFKTSFPELLKFANESEIDFFLNCTDPSVLFTFLQDFGIVMKKNLDFLKDVVDGNAAKVKKFLRVNKSKKDATSLRIAVNVACSFNHPEVLDHLIRSLDRDFLAKFEHVFLSLALLSNASSSSGSITKIFIVIFSWCNEPQIKVDLNTPHHEKNNTSWPLFKTLLITGLPKIFKAVLESETIKVESEDWVELFEDGVRIWASPSFKKDMTEAFNIFPAHDYFLARHRAEEEIYQIHEFFEDASDDFSDAETGLQVSDHESNHECNADVDEVDEDMDEEPNNETENVDTNEQVSDNKTFCEKYGIRSDISEEDLFEIMILFDKVISVSIREIMKEILVDKLKTMLEDNS